MLVLFPLYATDELRVCSQLVESAMNASMAASTASTVSSGEEVEQQPAGHGDAQTSRRHRVLARQPHRHADLDGRLDPRVDDPVEQLGGRWRPCSAWA